MLGAEQSGWHKMPSAASLPAMPWHFSVDIYLQLSSMLESTNPFSTGNFDPNFTTFSAFRARQGAKGAVLSLVPGQDQGEWQAGSGKALVE